MLIPLLNFKYMKSKDKKFFFILKHAEDFWEGGKGKKEWKRDGERETEKERKTERVAGEGMTIS